MFLKMGAVWTFNFYFIFRLGSQSGKITENIFSYHVYFIPEHLSRDKILQIFYFSVIESKLVLYSANICHNLGDHLGTTENESTFDWLLGIESISVMQIKSGQNYIVTQTVCQ